MGLWETITPKGLDMYIETTNRQKAALHEMLEVSKQQCTSFANPYAGALYFRDGTFYTTNDVAVITCKFKTIPDDIPNKWYDALLTTNGVELLAAKRTIRAHEFDNMVRRYLQGYSKTVDFDPNVTSRIYAMFDYLKLLPRTKIEGSVMMCAGKCKDFDLGVFIVGR